MESKSNQTFQNSLNLKKTYDKNWPSIIVMVAIEVNAHEQNDPKASNRFRPRRDASTDLNICSNFIRVHSRQDTSENFTYVQQNA